MNRLIFALGFVFVAGCGGTVNSEEEARNAYLGFDVSIDKAITLGFAGFNGASSANIDAQTGTGTSAGTLVVTGQVDQGASANKTMRLLIAATGYSDTGKLTYTTAEGAPLALTMNLKDIPTGTLDGSLAGSVGMSGDQTGGLTLALTFTGTLQPNATDATKVERKPGTTHIIGAATSSAGVYTVDVTR